MKRNPMLVELGYDAREHIRLERDGNQWVEIPGYYYRYRINEYATVQRYSEATGTWRTLSQYKQSSRAAVKLTLSPGVAKHIYVVDLMADAFMGGRQAHPGKVLTHANRCVSDCSLNNLVWVTRKESGKLYGGGGRVSIEKLDRNGEVVDLFKSTVECCKKEFISRKTLWRILTGRAKNPYQCTGYTYRYESECD